MKQGEVDKQECGALWAAVQARTAAALAAGAEAAGGAAGTVAVAALRSELDDALGERVHRASGEQGGRVQGAVLGGALQVAAAARRGCVVDVRGLTNKKSTIDSTLLPSDFLEDTANTVRESLDHAREVVDR